MTNLVGIIIIASMLFVILTGVKLARGFNAFGYNATTGNYEDPNNPNNAENIIIQYCIDHADRVANGENVVQTLVNASLVPIYYDGKTCLDVQNLHKESEFQEEVHEAQDSLRETLLGDSNSEKDKITRELYDNLPKDTQDKVLESLAK